jgi:hypothetical protein
MKKLLLNSLEINEYRVYDHLLIQSLGRVNLFVGKNNVGKSSVLEALWLYSQRCQPSALTAILQSRDELSDSLPFLPSSSADVKDRIWSVKYLFHGRRDVRDHLKPIRIGPIDAPSSTLSVGIEWFIINDDEQADVKHRYIPDPNRSPDSDPYLTVKFGPKRRELHRLDRVFVRNYRAPRKSEFDSVPGQFIRANGLDSEDVANLWDAIALTDLEDFVVEALHLIAPEVRRVSFIGPQGRSSTRVPVARIDRLDEPVPLRSMGEGMNRILGIILALANARNGILLIDEIESGLHYTVQTNMWRLVFKLAHTLNVQVFTTTHSWDCLESFQKAAVKDTAEDGLLIRLERKGDEISTTLFDEKRLSIATREQIEVR